MRNRQDLEWGPVVIEDWFEETRIGYYDDDDVEEGTAVAILYPGDMLLTMNLGYRCIPYEFIRPVTTDDLWQRREVLFRLLGPSTKKMKANAQRYERLCEFAYIEGILMERMFEARFGEKIPKRGIFISHSSKDKKFAKWVSVDLANSGHKPWLDEWDIKAGESIPKKIGDGIRDCDFVLVLLTENSTKSNWVENEWQIKYWDEIQEGQVKVIPALFGECEIPTLLKHKKYADFRHSYSDGFEDILNAIR